MTEYSNEVREEAARRAKEAGEVWPTTEPDHIAGTRIGRALCKAVADGLLHVDPVELDRARWEEAGKNTMPVGAAAAKSRRSVNYRRLVIGRVNPIPEPVDPVAEVAREVAAMGLNKNWDREQCAEAAIRAWIEREAGQ